MAASTPSSEEPRPGQLWLRRTAEVLLIAALFYGVVTWQSRDMLPSDGATGIPQFSLPDLNGVERQVAPDRRETLVYFFAPWCGICRATINHLDAVDPDTTQLIVIALDYASEAAVQEFVTDTGLSYPVLLGTESTRQLFRVQAYPTYYTLDHEFRVIGRAMGALTAIGLRLR